MSFLFVFAALVGLAYLGCGVYMSVRMWKETDMRTKFAVWEQITIFLIMIFGWAWLAVLILKERCEKQYAVKGNKGKKNGK